MKKFTMIILLLAIILNLIACGNTDTHETTETSEPITTATTPNENVTEPSVEITEPVEHLHSYTLTVTAPGCETEGYTTYTCDCGDTYVGDNVTAIGHSWSQWRTTAEPTEDATGTAERICSVCAANESKVLDKVIAGHTHSYSSEISKAATCTTEGIVAYTCSCGGGYTESIAKLGHDYKSAVTKPTCTAKGYTTYTCSRCNDNYKGKYTSAAGHSWSNWETTKEPTVSATGTAERKCSVCGDRETKTLDKLVEGHTHSYTKVVTAPTCKDDGYTTYTCTCGDRYFSDQVYATGCECEFVVTQEPTCTEDGVQWMTCTICGDQLWSDIIPATGHDIVNLGSVEFVREYAICPHCDVYLCELGSWILPHSGIDVEEIMLSVCSCDPNDALLDHIKETDGSFAHHSWANAYEYVTIIGSRTKCNTCGLVSVYDSETWEFVPVDGVNDAPNHIIWDCGYCGTKHSTKEAEKYFPNP